jgi:hypothetical protein
MWIAQASTDLVPLTLWKTFRIHVLVCSLCWGILYALVRKLIKNPAQYSSYRMNLLASECISMIHSFVSAAAAIYCLSKKSVIHQDPIWGYDSYSIAVLVFSTGYLIYDTIFVLLNFRRVEDLQFAIHHIVALLIYGYACFVSRTVFVSTEFVLETVSSLSWISVPHLGNKHPFLKHPKTDSSLQRKRS